MAGFGVVDFAVKAQVTPVGVAQDGGHQQAVVKPGVENLPVALGASRHLDHFQGVVPDRFSLLADLVKALSAGLDLAVVFRSGRVHVGNTDLHGDAPRAVDGRPTDISADLLPIDHGDCRVCAGGQA